MKAHVVFGTIAAFVGGAGIGTLIGWIPSAVAGVFLLIGAGSGAASAYLLSQGE